MHENHRASKNVKMSADVARDLEAILRNASGKRRLNGRQRAQLKKYASFVKAKLDNTRRDHIRVSRVWCLVVLRLLACLVKYNQDVRRVVERVMGWSE